MQAGADAVPAEQHYAEETGFEEEGGQHFIGQQRPGNAAGELGEEAPVGAELIGHHQPGHHAHAEVDGENL